MEKYRTEELYGFDGLEEIVAFLKQPDTYLTYTTEDTGCMKDITEPMMDLMRSTYSSIDIMERELPDDFGYENVTGHRIIKEDKP